MTHPLGTNVTGMGRFATFNAAFLYSVVKGPIFNSSGNWTGVDIFLWNRFECSKRYNVEIVALFRAHSWIISICNTHTFKWKHMTMGNLLTVNCFVDSCCLLHLLHSIFTADPKCSARVNCSRQSTKDKIWTGESELNARVSVWELIFNDISVNCSTFVETLLKMIYRYF